MILPVFRVFNCESNKIFHLDGTDGVLELVIDDLGWHIQSLRWDNIAKVHRHFIEANHENGVLMQDTGLKDVASKEVYEGDILDVTLRTGAFFDGVNTKRFTVEREIITGFSPFTLFELNMDVRRAYNFSDTQLMQRYKVVGNIYQNKDLI